MIARVSSLSETWSKDSDKMYSMNINDVVKYIQASNKALTCGPKFVVYDMMVGFADCVKPWDYLTSIWFRRCHSLYFRNIARLLAVSVWPIPSSFLTHTYPVLFLKWRCTSWFRSMTVVYGVPRCPDKRSRAKQLYLTKICNSFYRHSIQKLHPHKHKKRFLC